MAVRSFARFSISHSLGNLHDLLGLPYEPSGLFSSLVLGEEVESQGPRGSTIVAVLWTLLNIAIGLGAVAGLWLALRDRAWIVVLSCLPTISAVSAATALVGLGNERLRLPVMPLLFLLLMVAFSKWQTRCAGSRDDIRARGANTVEE